MDEVPQFRCDGRLHTIHVSELPAGWMEEHAMWTAGAQATGGLVVFTDADVLFKPDWSAA